MRAAVYDRYGSPDVVRIEEVPTPSPGAGQVLVRVAATSINLSDWECLRGSPLYARIGGLRAPARRTLGSDIAGRVEGVGEGVTREVNDEHARWLSENWGQLARLWADDPTAPAERVVDFANLYLP